MNTTRFVPAVLSLLIVQGLAIPAALSFGACPDARFAAQVAAPAGGGVEGIAIADFDGDGRPDLAVTNFTAGGGLPNSVAILLGNREGTFQPPTRFPVGRGATRIVASDFNADGKPDVAVLNSNDGTISVLLGDGRGGLGPQTKFPTGGGTVGLALGDFNGDEIGDLVVSDLSANRITVLFGATDGSFSIPTPFPVGSGALLVAVGDLNADGHPDLAVGNADDATVSILLGRGDGTFAPQTIVPLPNRSTPLSLILSDLNGDRIPDLVVVDGSDDTVLVLSGHGDGSFDAPAAFAVGRRPVFVALGDLNSDGQPDLAVGNVDDATVSILLGRGDGTFDPQTTLVVGSQPIPVAIGDLNGDGALDIVTGNFADQTVSVLLNECTGNRPPIASSGADQVLECTGASGAAARLDASGSADPDSTPGTNDDIIGFDWSEQGRLLASGPTASIPFARGTHAVSLKVTDRAGGTGFDATNITVEDTTPPEINSIVANPAILSPPNQRLVPVSIIAVAADRCDAAPSCKIVSVTNNESTQGPRPGIGPDSVITDPGPKTSPAQLTVLLRAGRAGAGPGRIYTINVSCGDSAGNVISGRTTVKVAHDLGRPARTPRILR